MFTNLDLSELINNFFSLAIEYRFECFALFLFCLVGRGHIQSYCPSVVFLLCQSVTKLVPREATPVKCLAFPFDMANMAAEKRNSGKNRLHLFCFFICAFYARLTAIF